MKLVLFQHSETGPVVPGLMTGRGIVDISSAVRHQRSSAAARSKFVPNCAKWRQVKAFKTERWLKHTLAQGKRISGQSPESPGTAKILIRNGHSEILNDNKTLITTFQAYDEGSIPSPAPMTSNENEAIRLVSAHTLPLTF